MTTATRLRAHYSKGKLTLEKPLRLPEGAAVEVTVMPLGETGTDRKPKTRTHAYPTRVTPWHVLEELNGLVSLGGDALAHSEALCDGD